MTEDPRERDRRQREAWRRAAEGWERRQADLRRQTAAVSRWLVDAVDPQPGQRLLELAAGPGETGFLAAQRLGDGGTLISSDQSPEMVEVARRRAGELGLHNVEFIVLDAQELDLAPASFDATLCRWGYMLMGNPDEALRRTRRVLREGGRLALATWAAPDRNLWMVAPVLQLVGRGAMPMPNPSDPSPFAMADPAALERRLLRAGFGSAELGTVKFAQTYESFDQYWAVTLDTAAPTAVALAELGEPAAAEVREAVREALASFTAQNGTMTLPASSIVAVATA